MSYEVKGKCSNCGHSWDAKITHGTTRRQWEETAECPNCKVKGNVSAYLIR